jgi:hypothetical protein
VFPVGYKFVMMMMVMMMMVMMMMMMMMMISVRTVIYNLRSSLSEKYIS